MADPKHDSITPNPFLMKRDYVTAHMSAGPADRPMRYNDYNNMAPGYSNNLSPAPAAKGKQLMSFQNYVRTLSNQVDENTAYKKYKDFMANLSQSKVGRFFDANKDREWFRLKYHPVEGQKTLQQQTSNFQKRLKIFTDLDEKGYFQSFTYTANNASTVLNLMDAVIVQLEDGPQELVEQLLSPEDTKIDLVLRQKYVPVTSNSLVIDDIGIETTLSAIQDVCTQASEHLIRIAPLEPYYIEGGHLRRKFVAIYERFVNIRDVCWKLSRLKLNNKSLSVSINKCITNRIHTVDAIANSHIAIVNDIRHAVILILNFDEVKGLFGKRKQSLETSSKQTANNDVTVKMEDSSFQDNKPESMDIVAPLSPPGSEKSAMDEDEEKPFDVSSLDEDKEKEKKKLFEFKFNTEMSLCQIVSKLEKSDNPVLQGAHNYLVEFIESAGARYQYSKVPSSVRDESVDFDLDKSDNDKYSTIELIVQNLQESKEESTKILDRMLWYLRVVHSFDYYKKLIYKQEDELTLRMSVIHLREDPSSMQGISVDALKAYLLKESQEFEAFGQTQVQKYVTRDEERFNYKSYGKVITDELASYAQRIQKPKSTETEEVYKCKHCTRIFQKLCDIGRHFVSKHRWAIDAIELETDFFNSYLFDAAKINPCPPKELLEVAPNRFARLTCSSQMGEDPDLLQQTIEAYSKLESFATEPAPRAQVESDPRNDMIVDYADISFDDAI